jgi:hypothetical protein
MDSLDAEAHTLEEPLPVDVLARLTRDFGERAGAVAALLLARRRIGGSDFLDDHLLRCTVHAAFGDEQRVQHLLDLERQDFRYVIVAGEEGSAMRQVRDLRVSFLIDSPEKFWAGEMTCLMALRGYRLAGLDSRPTTAGPFTYTSDYSEGRATFLGPKGEIVIEKKDRQWMIHGNRRELAVHELDQPFSDEQVFRDAVSGYLLSNVRAARGNEPKETQGTEAERRPWWRF